MKLELQNLELGQVVWFWNQHDMASDDKAHVRFYSDYIFKLRIKRRGKKCMLVTVLDRVELPGLKTPPRPNQGPDPLYPYNYYGRNRKRANTARPDPGEVYTNTRDVFEHGVLAETPEDFGPIFEDLAAEKAQNEIGKAIRLHQIALDKVQELQGNIAKIQAEIQALQENRIPECERNIELAKRAFELTQNTTVIDRAIADCI